MTIKDFHRRPTFRGTPLALQSEIPTVPARHWKCTWFFGGDLQQMVGVGHDNVPNSGSPVITEVVLLINTKPTTQNVIVDLNSVNDSTNARTSLYTTQANRPQITPGGNFKVNGTLPDTTSLSPGAQLAPDIDQVGSGTVGKDLTVIVRGTY